MGFDLVRGATVVTPGHRETADIGIADGRIAQLGLCARRADAGGLLAIPAGSTITRTWCTRNWRQARDPDLGGRLLVRSKAAITGGITTIGNMTRPVPDEDGTEETPAPRLPEMAAAPEAAVDWFLHPILLHPATLPEGEAARPSPEAGTGIKIPV